MENKIVLDENEVSELTGIAVSTLQKWRMRGEGPRYAKLGARLVRYRREDIEDFIRANLYD